MSYRELHKAHAIEPWGGGTTKSKKKGAQMKKKQLTRKQEFIEELAEFLVGDQCKKSIQLQMGSEDAKKWSRLRSKTPLFGYPTKEEAMKTLTEFLGND